MNEPKIDTTVPHSARMWNYWLGGKDHYEVDRVAGDQFAAAFPDIVAIARLSRYLLSRIVRHLSVEAGVAQFLDIGTGLPTVDNTHDLAQRINPEARVVYVDNDPLVLSHARALLVGTREGVTDYMDADLRDPARILAGAAESLDFDRPVGLMLMGILGYVGDHEEAYEIVRTLMKPLPSGSYLAIWDGSNVVTGEALDKAQDELNEGPGAPYTLRNHEEISRFFDGLDLVEPGVVPITQWRPEPDPFGPPSPVDALVGVARKP
ncbi:SAM-dependent methyltransferase [Herbidospora cretacea]|uniref:SAM-dependent methyltransferase n=1 Tax=Herbidospora cretacea TaxID=28444 RepID=UPI000A46C014|nr:SAM-dependent methyltransferase [Herbidospora cretacea]